MTSAPPLPGTLSPLHANLRTNGGRLWDSLMEMAQVGPGIAGGNNRQALTLSLIHI